MSSIVANEQCQCWNGLRGIHLFLYHLSFMIGLISGVPPSWYESQVVLSSSLIHVFYFAARNSHITVLS
jgi:hypothetical protein